MDDVVAVKAGTDRQTGVLDQLTLVIGYGTPPAHAFAGALDRLATTLAELR